MVQPRDGIAPLLAAVKAARKSIDILIFRMDWKALENALTEASGRGIAVRALIANTNRNGEPRLRSLETRFLAAGITVGRTDSDLIRYHGKMMIVDGQTLFLLSFNFVHIDIEHSRGFGIVTKSASVVREAIKLFEADLNRQKYSAGLNGFVVSPVNARKQLSEFIGKARKQLFIYDPKIADKQIIRLLEHHAEAGLEIRIIGTIESRNQKLLVTPLTSMRLHTRTIIRDGSHAFVGSQSLREPELDLRREIGVVIREPKIVSALLATFREDWDHSGFDEAKESPKETQAGKRSAESDKAAKKLVKAMPPLRATLKKAIRKALKKADTDSMTNAELKDTVKAAVKTATKEAVREMVDEKKAS